METLWNHRCDVECVMASTYLSNMSSRDRELWMILGRVRLFRWSRGLCGLRHPSLNNWELLGKHGQHFRRSLGTRRALRTRTLGALL